MQFLVLPATALAYVRSQSSDPFLQSSHLAAKLLNLLGEVSGSPPTQWSRSDTDQSPAQTTEGAGYSTAGIALRVPQAVHGGTIL